MKTEIIDDPDPENDSETCCKSCGDEYALRDGCEPTKYCDQCAHKVVERVEAELDKQISVTLGQMQTIRQLRETVVAALEWEHETSKAMCWPKPKWVTDYERVAEPANVEFRNAASEASDSKGNVQ